MEFTRSKEIFNRAESCLPGGVNSPVRAFKSVGGEPVFIDKADGCRLVDIDGNEYIDYIGSWGPMILGHNHPDVLSSLQEAVKNGTSFGTPTRLEVQLAEEVINRVSSIEKLRFVNSGTEATMSAIRLARAYTGRDTIVKFAGGYHGHADSFLIEAGSGAATLGIPNSPGVPASVADNTRISTFNDLEQVADIFENEGEKIAAVIVEPVAGNMGVVPPVDGFLQGLRDLCDHYGSVLIFDEVMTGFRVSPGGAQKLYGIIPDLTTLGKIIGGGLPVGAYGGKIELMEMVAPQGPVYQAGTLSGNPVAMAAGLATLKNLNKNSYETLERMSGMLEEGLVNKARESGIPVTVQRVGSMLTLFFADKPVRNYNHASSADHQKFSRFFHGMLENGIHLPPSGYEAWFVSLAHNNDSIEKTIDVSGKIFIKLLDS